MTRLIAPDEFRRGSIMFIVILLSTACCTSPAIRHDPHDDRREATTPVLPELEGISEVRAAILAWDLAKLKRAADGLRADAAANADEAYRRRLWRGTALFHAVLVLRADSSEEAQSQRKALTAETVDALQGAVESRSDDSDCHAMLAVLYGMQISNEPLLALTLGKRVLDHREAAAKAINANPRVGYLEGVSLLNRSSRRSSVSQAVILLLEAEQLFAREADESRADWQPDWGRPHCRMFLAEAYEQLGDMDQAMGWFEKALQMAPQLTRAKQGYERCRQAIKTR